VPDLTIPDANGAPLKTYVARPAVGDGPWPGVVVIHDAFGLSDVAREHADRLSAAGYLALVPDLYTRGGFARCVRSTFAALMSGTGLAYDDLDAARRWLEAQAACTGRIGVIGFCMGGGFALMTARRGYSAAAPNYGRYRWTCPSSTAHVQSSPAMGRRTARCMARRHSSPLRWRSAVFHTMSWNIRTSATAFWTASTPVPSLPF
jgi:dienelactone hydrolase